MLIISWIVVSILFVALVYSAGGARVYNRGTAECEDNSLLQRLVSGGVYLSLFFSVLAVGIALTGSFLFCVAYLIQYYFL